METKFKCQSGSIVSMSASVFVFTKLIISDAFMVMKLYSQYITQVQTVYIKSRWMGMYLQTPEYIGACSFYLCTYKM